MAKLGEQGTLMGLFGDTKPEYHLHADKEAQRFAREEDNRLHGQKSGSVDGVINSSAAASKKARETSQDKAERKSKQQFDDLLLLTLLQQEIEAIDKEIGFLEDQIDQLTETIDKFANGEINLDELLQEPHVQRAIAEWEARNPGQSYDRNDDNAEAILNAIMKEQVELDKGDIKGLKTDKAERLLKIEEIKERRNNGQSIDEVKPDAVVIASTMAGADELATALRGDLEIAAIARNNQNEMRDEITTSEDTISNEDTGFGSILDASSESARNEFQKSAALPISESDGELTNL